MKRPIVGSDPRWPRPRQRLVEGASRVSITMTSAPSCVSAGTATAPAALPPAPMLPVPWIASTDPALGFMPAAYDNHRATRMVNEDLCQVCGEQRGDEVYVLVGHDAEWTDGSMSGGALCSERCARLTAAVCPHYRTQWPVHVYAVPHLGERTSVGSMRDLDDRADLNAPGARRVSTVGGP